MKAPEELVTEVIKKDEKAETAIDIEENVENKNNLDKIIIEKETNAGNKLDKDVLNITSENIVDTLAIGNLNTALQHDKQFKSTQWVQYNKAYTGQDQVQGPKQNMGGMGIGGHDEGGAPLEYDPQTRNVFVKLVFVIVLVMLLLTAAYVITVLMTPNLKRIYMRRSLIIMLAAAIALIAMNFVLACSACARVPPCNFVCLALVVVAMSNLVSAVTVKYKTHILVYALAATSVMVFVCILLACSSFDFTKFYIYIIAIAVVFTVISMMVSIAMFVMRVKYKPLQIVMLFVGGIISVVIFIMELQMILGGRAVELSEDDYALGAYMLYTSIVDIFLKMVRMFGLLED